VSLQSYQPIPSATFIGLRDEGVAPATFPAGTEAKPALHSKPFAQKALAAKARQGFFLKENHFEEIMSREF
jgi:hypothetical protein